MIGGGGEGGGLAKVEKAYHSIELWKLILNSTSAFSAKIQFNYLFHCT